ncbi:hypothetical protein HMPREF1553_00483 [Porphyromonas gingivalis F0568]|nr:hypothetical protein HMPREF1553_00483 [Porphyromonas gingivalis F0568]
MHHTGIKTFSKKPLYESVTSFQLHHTGIKTSNSGHVFLFSNTFQLHHTGIKTHVEGREDAGVDIISIAPYRN